MTRGRMVLQAVNGMRRRPDTAVPLRRMAAATPWSAFHFHRVFTQAVGETPKQYTLRLRLDRAAARLATGAGTVLAVALDAGFSSHEVFTRAFRRHFGCTPLAYRSRARAGASAAARLRHQAVVNASGPCIGLFHFPTGDSRRPSMPMLSIERRQMPSQPVLFVRRTTSRQELPAAIGEGIGKSYGAAHGAGLAFAGPPYTRYPSMGPGLITIEAGMPLASAGRGEGDVEAGELPAGPAVVAMHGGPYDQLSETYAAMERWAAEQGLRLAGAPWESYITDPADHPDPAAWRTEVYWPLEK